MPALFLDTVSSWTDRLNQTGPDGIWARSVEFTREIGALGLIAAEVDLDGRSLVWMRSSLDPGLIATYEARGYILVDPVLHHALDIGGRLAHRVGLLTHATAPDPLSLGLDRDLAAAGFDRIEGETTVGGAPGHRRIIALGLPPGTIDDLHETTLRRLLMAIIATALPVPDGPDAPGLIFTASAYRLTCRERDVLRQLASGLRNDAIAYNLGVAEITVRKHVASARDKLGAATREQAVAVALRAGVLRDTADYRKG